MPHFFYTRGNINIQMKHHFGWEDAAKTEKILSNGNWRADFNGTQYYLDEEDGYDDFRDWPRNKYKSKRRRNERHVDNLTPVDGWNMYDRGWSKCVIKEECLRESWDGQMCQDDLALQQRMKRGSATIHPRTSTHVLSVSSTAGTNDSDQGEGEEEQQTMHWKEITRKSDQISELMEFIRELLRGREESKLDLALAKRMERVDRRGEGVLERHQFEGVLDSFELLDLLSRHEMDDLFDHFSDKISLKLKYRSFVRSLLKNKVHTKAGTLVRGSWRDDKYTARIVVSCNRDVDDDEDEGSYMKIKYARRQKRIY